MSNSKDTKAQTPNVTNLPEGATSAYTACVECGRKFTQRNGTTRFRALARHYYNGCS